VIGGRRVEVVYRIELDPSRDGGASETLEVGDRGVDVTAGRAFLVDLTAATPAYRQPAVPLPVLPKLGTTGEVEQLVEVILKDLEAQDTEIRAFLR